MPLSACIASPAPCCDPLLRRVAPALPSSSAWPLRVVGLVVVVFGVGCFGSGPVGRGYRACMIDSFAFHLPAARVFLPQGFSLACIDAGFVFSLEARYGIILEVTEAAMFSYQR